MRRLDAKEVQVRIDRFFGGKNGKPTYGSLFLYIDARTAQQMLDDEFGPTGWKAEYEMGNNTVLCSISVWDKEKNEWVIRQDVGGGNNGSVADTTKTMFSDAFKRTAVAWGVGRELYLGPQIKFDTSYVNVYENNGKWQCYDNFIVRGIDYDERGNITALSIFDVNTGHSIFEYDVRPNELTETEVKKYEDYFKKKGVDIKIIEKALNLKTFKDITRKQVKDIMANPSILELKGEEAVQALPNTTKGMPADMPKKEEDKGDFMQIEDSVEDEIPFK